jgi:hypothetical protein
MGIILRCCSIFVWGNWQKNTRVVTIDGYEDVPVDSEKSLQKAVANQPISVTIEGAGRAFQFYESVSFFDIVVLAFSSW